MQHSSTLGNEPARAGAAPATTPAGTGHPALSVADRSVPPWAGVVGTLFSAAASLCLLAVPVSALFFQSLVADQREPFAAPLIAAFVAVPVLGALILAFANARALAGFRQIRELISDRSDATVALVGLGGIAFVHPLLVTGPLAGGLAILALTALAARQTRREPAWDHTPEEAASLLSGRDRLGLMMAGTLPPGHALQPVIGRVGLWLGVLVSLAVASALSADERINPAAIPAIALISVWAVEALSRRIAQGFRHDGAADMLAAAIEEIGVTADLPDTGGLHVSALSVKGGDGRAILSDIGFDLSPGAMLGVVGSAGSGKTALLTALAAPWDLAGATVQGFVAFRGASLWSRHAEARDADAVLVPPSPLLLKATGADNLSCCGSPEALIRGKAILEQLVFSADEAQRIADAPSADDLSSSQAKALVFARAFLLSPGLYLLDRPEDHASEVLTGALVARIAQERRLGRTFILVTEDRRLLEACDKLIVLQDGRIIDFGEAGEIRRKMSSGWIRFVAAQSLESDENLVRWSRALFKRPGDDGNRRNVATVASELLALSCQSAPRDGTGRIAFEYKHFDGYGVLRMIDDAPPLSNAQITRAKEELAAADEVSPVSPLAAVFRGSLDLAATVEQDRRVIEVRIETYDPRRPSAAKAGERGTTGR